MFDKEKRYITCGIDQRLPQDLQRLIWTSVDARILFSNEKIDYLQVFTFKKIDGEILARAVENYRRKMAVVKGGT